jgi:hypothetical protein
MRKNTSASRRLAATLAREKLRQRTFPLFLLVMKSKPTNKLYVEASRLERDDPEAFDFFVSYMTEWLATQSVSYTHAELRAYILGSTV